MKSKDMLQKGNLKLHKGVGVFSLPAEKTCPGRTPFCSRVCYAKKAERLYKGVLPHRMEMLKATQRTSFVATMDREIRRRGFRQIRIHEAGDFFSQAYLNKWIEIANLNPGVVFLAYTKNFGLDFTQVPANFRLYASLDESTEAVLRAKGWSLPVDLPSTWITPRGKPGRPGAYQCTQVDSKAGHTHYCGLSCIACWTGQSMVDLPQH